MVSKVYNRIIEIQKRRKRQRISAQLKGEKASAAAVQRKTIIDLLGGDIQLRSKRELIQKFIDENMPHIKDGDSIEDKFEKFWHEDFFGDLVES